MEYNFSGFSLNSSKRELVFNKQSIYLTKKCYDLLVFLLQNSEKSLSKDQLVEHVWQGRIVTDNTIDQCISKLRKTLNDANPDEYIKSVYG